MTSQNKKGQKYRCPVCGGRFTAEKDGHTYDKDKCRSRAFYHRRADDARRLQEIAQQAAQGR